jgi:hypothetical protein
MRPLMVTTTHKGVFFGYGEPTNEAIITLKNARMCIYWPMENKGIVGLAKDGPKNGARVGPAASSIIIREVTAIFEVSESAAKLWEKEPWS